MFIGYIDPDMILMTGEMAVFNNKELVSFFFHPFSFCLPVWPRCDSVACSSILFSVTIYLEDMNTKKKEKESEDKWDI